MDDEEIILKLLSRAFLKWGYTVRTATSGEAALKILKTEDIHLMFFDLSMPDMNGLELCCQVRQSRPVDLIFALTGYSSLFELAECRGIGFDDYFTKPADLKLLKQVVEDAFEKQRRWRRG